MEAPHATQNGDGAAATPAAAIPKEQHKYCTAIVRHLKRSPHALPFLEPVDPIRLGIPTYFSVITHPIDLSTVENKLRDGVYVSVEEFVADVRLMIANCYKFNGRDAPVSVHGSCLEKMFESQLRNMPQMHVSPVAVTETMEGGVDNVGNVSPNGALGTDMRPKRAVHPPARASLVPGGAHRKKQKGAAYQIRFCQTVLRELLHKKHIEYSFAFLEPVDWRKLHIPDYPTIIQHPMDLATIKKRLDAGYYTSAEEFEADVRLMFRNCFTYNAPGNPVRTMGEKLEEVFNRKWREMPRAPPTPAPSAAHHYQQQSFMQTPMAFHMDQAGAIDQSGVIDLLERQISLFQYQVNAVRQQQEQGLAASVSGGPRRPSAKRPPRKRPTAGAASRMGLGGALSSPAPFAQPGQMFPPRLSFEHKKELVERMHALPEDKMLVAIEIIRTCMPQLQTENGEIELDIEALDEHTLAKLYELAFGHPPYPLNPASTATVASRPEKKMRTNMADDQDFQIDYLQDKLKQFENLNGQQPSAPAAANGVPADAGTEAAMVDVTANVSSSPSPSHRGSEDDSGDESGCMMDAQFDHADFAGLDFGVAPAGMDFAPPPPPKPKPVVSNAPPKAATAGQAIAVLQPVLQQADTVDEVPLNLELQRSMMLTFEKEHRAR